ncbi:MAG: hypothetical protein AAFV53_13405 [Myxococcota bacterium]
MISPPKFHRQWTTGARLSLLLTSYRGLDGVMIIGTPGGTMVIAAAIAETLDIPLDMVQPALLEKHPSLALPELYDRIVLLTVSAHPDPLKTLTLLELVRSQGPRGVILVSPRLSEEDASAYRGLTDDIVTLIDEAEQMALRVMRDQLYIH